MGTIYRVSIVGHFGEGNQLFDGQTVKTKILAEEIERILGPESIKTVDTYGWKRNTFALFI